MSAPRLARLIIRLAAEAERRDDALGDLEEAHRRRTTRGAIVAWCGTHVEAIVIALALVAYRVRSAMPGRGGSAVSFTDVRLGFRLMWRQPVLTLTAMLALTIGIGLASAGFALMETLLFSQLPFAGGDRFVRLRAYAESGDQQVALTVEDTARIAAQATLLEHLGAGSGGRANVALTSGDIGAIRTAAITPSSLALLPYAPKRGRLLSPADAAPGAPPVAMIRETFWRRSLASRDDVIGLTLGVAGAPTTIVGVVPDSFEFPNAPDLWTPIDESFREGRGQLAAGAQLFGVRARGESLDAVRGQLQTISTNLATPGRGRLRLEAIGFTDLGDMAVVLSTTLVTILLAVLAVIAANVANLILARSFARQREFALRSALGASRRRLVAQISIEVLIIGSIAAVLGSVAAHAVLRRLNAMDDVPIWIDFTGGPLTPLLVAAATLMATALAGAWPALRATRPGLAAGLQGGDQRTSDVRFGRIAGVMVTVQIAISIAMLNGALVLAQGFSSFVGSVEGLPANVLVAGVPLNAVRPGDGRPPVTATEVERIVGGLPGVMAAGLATSLPRHNATMQLIEIEPDSGRAPAPAQLAATAAVTPSFFAALDASVTSGRLFTEADRAAGAPRVAIVNVPFVQKFLSSAPPLGRRFRVVEAGATRPWVEIVGVVPDLGLSMGDPSLAAGYYLPLGLDTTYAYLAMRVAGDPLSHATPLRQAMIARDPALFLNRIELLEDVNSEDRGFFAGLAGAFLALGVVTLVLALAGVYAMMSLIVTRRTREIGVRLALGATSQHILRAVVGRAALQILSGALIGLALAWISLDARQILATRIGEGSAWTLPAVVALLVAAGLAAAWWPVRRALSVRPVDALRVE